MKPSLPLDLDVRDMRLVAAVAHHGTLTKAGEVLHVTQSGLSHQLADLERRLGAPVFERVGRRMVPTPVGERLRDASAQILASLTRTEDEVRSVLSEREAAIRLATECYTCYHWLPPVLVRFRERFPKVETRILAEYTRQPIPALLDGKLDLAITSWPPSDRRLALHPVLRDELVAVVSPAHPWAGRRHVDPGDFADQHLFLYHVAPTESTLYQEFLGPAGVSPRRLSHVPLTEAVVELVKADLGITVLARWVVVPQLEDGSLVAVRLGKAGLGREWSAVTRRRKDEPAHLRAFVDLVAKTAFPIRYAPRARRRA